MNENEQIVAALRELRDELRATREQDAQCHANTVQMYAEQAKQQEKEYRRAEAMNKVAVDRWFGLLTALAIILIVAVLVVLSR
jgi:Fe2+ transport system protein B